MSTTLTHPIFSGVRTTHALDRMTVRGAAAGIDDLHPHERAALPTASGPVALWASPELGEVGASHRPRGV